MFPGRLIYLRGDLPWSARSPDLAPCAYFLWGYQAEVFKETSEDTGIIEEQHSSGKSVHDNIPIEMLEKVNRLRQCTDSNGRHFNGVLFKTV